MKNEVDNFFDSLSTGVEENKPFDIAQAITEKEPKEETDSQVAETDPVGASDASEDNLPFGKNPKIQKYIDRQIRKKLDESKVAAPEPQKVIESVKDSEMPAEWIMAYGDSDQSKSAWKLQQKLISDAVRQAKEETLTEVHVSAQKERDKERQYETFIVSSLESIEDSHDVDLTSNAPAAKKLRSDFLEMVKTISPKDNEGNVTEYADFDASWNLFNSVRQKTQTSESTSQKKALSSRSMSKSNEAVAYDPSAPKTALGFGSIDFESMFGK